MKNLFAMFSIPSGGSASEMFWNVVLILRQVYETVNDFNPTFPLTASVVAGESAVLGNFLSLPF